jgi:hypothetical protein
MSTNWQEANINPMGDFFEMLFEKVLDRVLEKRSIIFPVIDEETARQIARINAKVYITVPEAQFLLGCSDDLLYKHIREARAGKAKRPIPYLDIGVYTFHRETLLRWAHGEEPPPSGAA